MPPRFAALFFPGQPPYPPLSPQLVHAIKTALTHLPSLIQTSLKANPITRIMLDKYVFCRTADKFKLNAATSRLVRLNVSITPSCETGLSYLRVSSQPGGEDGLSG